MGALGLIAAVAACTASQGDAGDKTFRVGAVIVRGNTATPRSVVLGFLPFNPGEQASRADLRRTERWLAACPLFAVDPRDGTRPTVVALPRDDGSPFADIMVEVREKPFNWLLVPLAEGGWNLCARDFDAFRRDTAWCLTRRACPDGGWMLYDVVCGHMMAVDYAALGGAAAATLTLLEQWLR